MFLMLLCYFISSKVIVVHVVGCNFIMIVLILHSNIKCTTWENHVLSSKVGSPVRSN